MEKAIYVSCTEKQSSAVRSSAESRLSRAIKHLTSRTEEWKE